MEDYQLIYEALKEHFKSETAFERAQTAYENSNWKIGDATIEACGPTGRHGVNNGSGKKIQEAAKALTKKLNKEVTPKFLRERRDISCIYPVADRSATVSWTVYMIFRAHPEELLEWIKANPSGRGMSAAVARTIVGDLNKQAKDAPVEEDEQEETKPEEAAIAAGSGGDGSATIERTKDEETSETDKEDSKETQPLAAKDEETNDGQAQGEDAETDITEEEGEAELETEEELEVRRNKEKQKAEADMLEKVETLKDLAIEIAAFAQHNDPTVPWSRQADQTMKDVVAELNWFRKWAKERDAYRTGADVKRPKQKKPATVAPLPNGGSEEPSHAYQH